MRRGRISGCVVEVRFWYVYILQSRSHPERYYTGLTAELESRLERHNGDGCPHTAKFRPWRVKTAVAFADKARALAFERYLKSPSGRAFAKKRL